MKQHAGAVFFLLFMVSWAGVANSQVYSASKCKRRGNPSLAAMIRKGEVKKLTWMGSWHLGLYACDWATSFLAPTGHPPKQPSPKGNDLDRGESDYQRALEKWSCMYSPWSAMDGNSRTAWSEGKKGYGEGEILLVKVDTLRRVKIWAGLGAGSSLFKKNSRPKEVRVSILQAEESSLLIGQYASGFIYRKIKVLAQGKYTLRDKNGYQPLPLPKYKPLKRVKPVKGHMPETPKIRDTTFVAIEILSVYPGTKYRDTCISEVRN